MFRRKNQIQRLCHSNRVQYCECDGETVHRLRHTLRPGQNATIFVDCCKGNRWAKFTLDLPVRFALDRTPDGLFGRAMMRSNGLGYCRWTADIVESCDAGLYLCGRMPVDWLTRELVGSICQEMHEEAASFHQELRDKWNYAGFRPGQRPIVPERPAGPGVPMLRQGGPPQRPLSW